MRRFHPRRLIALLAGFVLAIGLSSPADASDDDDGIPVEVRVMDQAGNPISTAVVRHPEEEERHRVNTVTGTWAAAILYMPDGSMLKFEKGMELEFEVALQEMVVEEDEEEDFPIIGFGRDRPIGGIPVEGDEGGQ